MKRFVKVSVIMLILILVAGCGGVNSSNEGKVIENGTSTFNHTVITLDNNVDDFKTKYAYENYIDRVISGVKERHSGATITKENRYDTLKSEQVVHYILAKDNKIEISRLAFHYQWGNYGSNEVYYDPETGYQFEYYDVLRKRMTTEIEKVLPDDVELNKLRMSGNSFIFSNERGTVCVDKSYSWNQVLDALGTLATNEKVSMVYRESDPKYIFTIILKSDNSDFKAAISKLDELFSPYFKRNYENIVKDSFAQITYGK